MGVGHEFVTHFQQCTEAWLTASDPPQRDHFPFAFQTQFDFGWQHLMFGRLHSSICEHINEIYISTGIRREAQRFCALLIHRIWTHTLRPMWTARNKKVHALDSQTTQTRVHLDTITEAEELYHTTNIDMLPYEARKLFDDDIEDILARPYHALRAWCDTVEIEVLRQSSNDLTPQDDTQRLINPTRPKRLPTAASNPSLTPIQLRIKRRRYRHTLASDQTSPQHPSSMVTLPLDNILPIPSLSPLPLITPQNTVIPQVDPLASSQHESHTQTTATALNPPSPSAQPLHILPDKPCTDSIQLNPFPAPASPPAVPPRRRRRRLRLRLTPRICSSPSRRSQEFNSPLPNYSRQATPPSHETARTRLLRGSWRPP